VSLAWRDRRRKDAGKARRCDFDHICTVNGLGLFGGNRLGGMNNNRACLMLIKMECSLYCMGVCLINSHSLGAISNNIGSNRRCACLG